MPDRNPKVDAYIAARAPFARPLLARLRKGIHAAHPGLEEALKWGMPAFLHRGKIVCGIAGFQAHCALWFWHGATVVGPKPAEGMGNFGRLTTRKDLPSATALKGYVRKAVRLVEARAAKPATAGKPAKTAKRDASGRAARAGTSATKRVRRKR